MYTDALLEMDGLLLNITGRSDDRFQYTHASQLVIDSANERYIKKLCKYAKRRAGAKKNEKTPVTEYDGITKEENEKLYDCFTAKLGAKAYGYGPLNNVRKYLVADRGKFRAMEVDGQSLLLLEILKTFRCNSECSDLSTLGRGKKVGSLKTSCNITDCKSAYIINQSVTGLYEIKTNLLG